MTAQRTKWIAASVLALAIFAGGTATAVSQETGKPIPQPIIEGLKVAPDSARIDLFLPKFSNPTSITNPWFPISQQESVLLVGDVDGKLFRTEVTLLPYTRIVKWEGVEIEAAISQYVAYSGGRITEYAIDLYAQADDGSVWYLGEDVADFKDGVIISKDGTWHAGIDGPPTMIMPADPKVGNVYRSENWPGLAFEEVTITAADQTLEGPFGKLSGGVTGTELHFGGSTEDKQFAPRYGEFYTANADGDVEALAMAVPTDRASGAMPAELTQLTGSALAILKASGDKDWKTAAEAMKTMNTAWSGVKDTDVPKLVKPVLAGAIEKLTAAVGQRSSAKARNAAIEAARWSFDLQLRYRKATDIDIARLDLWAAQLQLDAAAGKAGAVRGDTFTMVLVKDRFIRSLDPGTALKINLLFGELQPAATDEELDTAAETAGKLRGILAGLAPQN
ncbi:MAG: hypothetical protein ACREDX_01310 [Aestuariivirga sp.]